MSRLLAVLVPLLALAFLAILAVTLGAAAEGDVGAGGEGGASLDVSERCDSCRTVIEQFYKGWCDPRTYKFGMRSSRIIRAGIFITL